MFPFFCVLVISGSSQRLHAIDLPKTAQLLPSETVLLIEVQNFTELHEQFKKTNFYRLYKDPAMADFLEDLKEKIRDELKEANSEFVSSILDPGILPEGRLALALILDEKTIDSNAPPLLLIIQAGERIAELKEYVKKMVAKEIDDGARLSIEDYRGVTVETLTEGDSAYSHCFVDDCFIIAPPDILKFVVAQIKGAASDVLADSPDYASVIKATGPVHDIDIYVNLRQLTKVYAAQDSTGYRKAFIANLGLDNLAAIGCAVGVARDGNNGSSLKAFVKIDGEKKGVLKMFDFESAPVKVPRFVPADFYSASFMNLDFKKAFSVLTRIVQGFSPQLAAVLLMPIIPPSPDGRPGLELKADIIDHLGAQYLSFTTIDKSVSTEDEPKTDTIVAVAANNRAALETSLSRFGALLSANDPDASRQLLGHTIYTIDLGALFSPFVGSALRSFGEMPSRSPAIPLSMMMPKIAFTVTDTHLIVGLEPVVERAIRTLSDTTDSHAPPAWFRRAKSAVPDVVGFAGLQDDAALAEVFWKTAGSTEPTGPRPPEDETHRSIGIGMSSTTGLSLTHTGPDLLNTDLLPDFETVKKYFGLSASYGIARPDGFFLEFKYINPE